MIPQAGGDGLKLRDLQIDGNLFLAPMAGVTDWAFRTICAQLGADVTVTEMVSSRALIYKDKKSESLLRKNDGSISAVQIFGNDPEIMAQAAVRAVELSNCDYLDINMGCPMPKIANSGDGCGLMKDPELAGNICRAVSDAVQVPVTIKCRLGWDKGNINVLDFTKRMEQSGAAAVTVHGRTRSMLYSGVADWDTIAKVKQQLSIPVIANGDIVDGASALRCLKRSGADGIMLGRATFGDPWLFAEVKTAMRGDVYARPCLAQRVDTALRQFRLALEDKGEHIACLEARKHFAWYLRGVAHSSFYKAQVSAISSMEDVERIARDIKRELK